MLVAINIAADASSKNVKTSTEILLNDLSIIKDCTKPARAITLVIGAANKQKITIAHSR